LNELVIAADNQTIKELISLDKHKIDIRLDQISRERKLLVAKAKHRRLNEIIVLSSAAEVANSLGIVENNFNVALSCNYYPIEIAPRLPKFKNNEGLDENDYLIKLSKEGLNQRIETKIISNPNHYFKRLDYELNIIHETRKNI